MNGKDAFHVSHITTTFCFSASVLLSEMHHRPICLALAYHLVDLEYSNYGGFIVGVLVSFITKGTTGLADPRTWVVIRPLLAHPLQVAITFIMVSVVTLLAYLAHRSQHAASRESQHHYNEALL